MDPNMLVVRPITLDDLDQLVQLARQADLGLTTLPRDRELLRRRILRSEDSFARSVEEPGGEMYVFVAEDLDTGRLVGTSSIVSRVGGFEPFYTYCKEMAVRQSEALGVHSEIEVLHLLAEHDGPSEIGTLFLVPEYRRAGYGRLLSLSRFLFMAEYRRAFADTVIAEIRGAIDKEGRSPFWEAVGRHFFEIDFAKADYLSMQDKTFIAELMPEHPIYIPLLPPAAQRAVGQVGEGAKPALKMLEDEGFVRGDRVDIFDAGPVVRCRVDNVRTVRRSQRATIDGIRKAQVAATSYIIARAGEHTRDFRACLGPVAAGGRGGVYISEATARVLDIELGACVRMVLLQSSAHGRASYARARSKL